MKKYQSRFFIGLVSLCSLLLIPSCSLVTQVSPVPVSNVSPELSKTIGKVEGDVIRTNLMGGVSWNVFTGDSATKRIALYKEEQSKLEEELAEIAYDDVKSNPLLHSRTLQELSKFIIAKASKANKNYEFVVTSSLKNEFLQYDPVKEAAAAKAAAEKAAAEKAAAAKAAQAQNQAQAKPAQNQAAPAQAQAQAKPAQTDQSQQKDAAVAKADTTKKEETKTVAKTETATNTDPPYGKTLDERGKAGLDVYLNHFMILIPILSEADSEKLLKKYSEDLASCRTAPIINSTDDIISQYAVARDVVTNFGLSSSFLPSALEKRKHKLEVEKIIETLEQQKKYFTPS